MYEAKKGKTLKEICSKVAVVRREATFKLAPTGGVRKPISQVATVNTPKRIGSIPRLFTTGNKTGVNIII